MTVPEAARVARAHNCTLRVVRTDGHDLVLTREANFRRIDVVTDRFDRVVAFDGIY